MHSMKNDETQLYDFFQILGSSDGTFITPVDCNEARTLCLQVLRILWERPGSKTSLTDFEQTFLHLYKQCCGRNTLESELQGVVQVRLTHQYFKNMFPQELKSFCF